MPSEVKGELESRLGRNLDDVRLHDDEQAAERRAPSAPWR